MKSGALQWLGQGETFNVGPYVLKDPLVYVRVGDGFVDEVSCIDPSLPIGRPTGEPSGSLGYFPEYSRLSPVQRVLYLQWLARGRTGPLPEIGYALLFLYGLERRLLLEERDRTSIIKEVIRLRRTYRSSVSFDGSLSRFLCYSVARAGITSLREEWFETVFERNGGPRDEQHLLVGLAWLFSRQRPLPASWALRIARLAPQAARSVVVERLPERFDALFVQRYRERHGAGLLLKAPRREREITYRPASPSLSDEFASSTKSPRVKIPDVMGLQSQFSSLVLIWGRCLEELKPLSRMMAGAREVRSRAAHDALANSLEPDAEHPEKSAWDRLAVEQMQEDRTVLVEVGKLARLRGTMSRPTLTARQSESLAQTAHAVGFIIEPDVRITHRPYGWNEIVALLRPVGSPALPADLRYPGAALMLELGMLVAAADGQVARVEADRIACFLESQFQLDPPDVRRLGALQHVFLKQRPSIAGLARRLKATLAVEQLESVGEFLVGVAAGGTMDKKKVAALRSVYRSLEIDAKGLEGFLKEHRRLEAEPVEVQPETRSADAGEAIPPRATTRPRIMYRLDAILIERLVQETRQVGHLLDEAMPEEQPVAEASGRTGPLPAVPDAGGRCAGLAARYRAVLVELCTRPSWTRTDFEMLVRNHSLMPSGTLDVINEWSQDRFDELIVEDAGNDLIVHAELVAEEP
jgi:hypothetical protein